MLSPIRSALDAAAAKLQFLKVMQRDEYRQKTMLVIKATIDTLRSNGNHVTQSAIVASMLHETDEQRRIVVKKVQYFQ